MEERDCCSKLLESDESELSLRPSKLVEYIGQANAKEMLDVYIKAALKRDESLDHVLLYGPLVLEKRHWLKLLLTN